MSLYYRINKIKNFFVETYESIVKKNTETYAADAAFFLFISLVPLIMLLLALLRYTPVAENYLIEVVYEIFPSETNILIVNVIEEIYGKSTTVISLTAVGAVWSASRSVMSISKGLNWIYGTEKSKKYFYTRIRATFYTVFFVVAVVLSLVILVFGNALSDFVVYHVPILAHLVSFIISFRILFVMAILTFVFMTAYKLLLDSKSKVKRHLPGALFASVAWTISSFIFSVYVDVFSGFSNMYGSLTTIVLIMLWLYFCMYSMLIGAGINVYVHGFKKIIG